MLPSRNLAACLGMLVALLGQAVFAQAEKTDLPNILWITAEDHGPHLSCYGDTYAITPNLDGLAAKGMRFDKVWSCLPVCAPARTAIITGMYPNSLGAEHMRSMVELPEQVQMYPQILRAAGYYCTNNSKEDYNVSKRGTVWDDSSNKAHWNKRQIGQPFFAVFNFTGSHESQIWKKKSGPHDPAKAPVPTYHPDLPEVRADWAQYYDNVTASDAVAGKLLQELADANVAEDTIVFYYGDHGSGMPRSKRTPLNSGLHVPLIVYFPEKWKHLAPQEYLAGGHSSRLVNFVDLAPTLVSMIGQKPPEWMQGSAFAGPHQTEPPKYLFGLRGRMDSRYDLVRSATDGRYVYVRNFMPHLPHGQHVHYQFQTDTTRLWYELFRDGKLNEIQSQFWSVPRAPEELYDLQSDPDEVQNLAGSAENQAKLAELREAVHRQIEEIRDVDLLPEADMIARSAGKSPYDALKSNTVYPFFEVLQAAELASGGTMDDLSRVTALFGHPDAGVRYWGVLGVRIRGAEAVQQSSQKLLHLLNDPSPDVRMAAGETLGILGDDAQAKAGGEALLATVEQFPENIYIVMEGVNAIERVGKRMLLVDNIRDRIQGLPEEHQNWESRAAGKPGLVKQDIVELLGK